jgi:sporulation protein YlmC with PRC-barrel domain
MREIDVDAEVQCADGPCGKSIALIVDRGTRRVTHFAVEDESLPYAPYQRLVPLDQVAEAVPGLIRLKCTRDELNRMDPFIHTRYVMQESEDYALYEGGGDAGGSGGWGTASTAGVASTRVEEEQVPEGEVAIHPGTRVQATDGRVGVVEELMVDPDTAQVTHIVLEQGHWWGKKEVQIPLSEVDHVEGDTVYLKIDKNAIGDLPVIHR